MKGRYALITGAASGLGREISFRLARAACHLILVDKDQDGLEQTRDMLPGDMRKTCIIIAMDLARPGAADELIRHCEGVEVDVLVNNAGFGVYGFFTDTDWKVEEAMLQLQVLTLTHICKGFLPGMVDRGWGRILNVSSMAAFQPGPLMNVYYASKAYILSFTEALSNELKGTGVKATVLLPGLFNTNFAGTTARNSGSAEKKEKHASTTVGEVADQAMKALLRGKRRVIPGWNNRLLAFFSRRLPVGLVMWILRRAQEKIRE